MFEKILTFDEKLFHSINSGWACEFFDRLMPIVTDNYASFLLLIFLMILILKDRRKGLIITLFAIIAVGLSDSFAYNVLKPMFGRLRPCWELDVRLLVRCGGKFSFPSNHAANVFAFTCAVGYVNRKSLMVLIPAAILVSISRVYVGVHYHLDITAGAIVGAGFGILSGFFANKLITKKFSHDYSIRKKILHLLRREPRT